MSGRPRVAVLGSLNMDISVTVPALPGPGATVLGSAATFAPGGKGANQAVAAARLGGAVRMAGCVGDDDFGTRMLAALQAEAVDTAGVRAVPGIASGLALITVDAAGENMITVASGANAEVGAAELDATFGGGLDVLVLCAEIPGDTLRAALSRARDEHVLCVLNLAPAPPGAADIVASGVDWLVVNESEAAAVLGRPVTGLAAAAAAAADLAKAGARFAVVTAGAAGAALAGPDVALRGEVLSAGLAPHDHESSGLDEGSGSQMAPDPSRSWRVAGAVTVPGFRVRAVDSVGAGDTFVGALAVTLAAGVEPTGAVRAACAAGASAATRPGTQSAMPRPADVLADTGMTWPLLVAGPAVASRSRSPGQ